MPFKAAIFAAAVTLALAPGASPGARAETPAPAGAGANTAAPQERTLRISQSHDIVTIDWGKSSYSTDSPAIQNLQEGLLAISNEYHLKPDLAQSWTTSPDGRIYRFNLKTGLQWSDGAPLTAQNFVDAWKRLLSRATAAPYAYLLFDVKNAQEYYRGQLSDFGKVGIRAPDALTLEVELKQPVPTWLWGLTFWATFPVRQDLIEKQGNLWSKPGILVNDGAFILDSHELGRSLSFHKNPHYPLPSGNVARMELLIRSGSELESMFAKGDVDIVFSPNEKLRQAYEGKPELKWVLPTRTKRLSFNLQLYPFSLPVFREAVARAIDRAALAKKLGEGFHTAGSLVPERFLGHDPKGGLPYDPAQAKKLLAGISGLDPSSLKLTLLVPTFTENSGENLKAALFVQDSIQKNLGVRVELQPADDSDKWVILSRSGDFGMILHDWSADYPDSETFYSTYSSRSKHTIQWSNADYDKRVDAAREEKDLRKRDTLYRSADELLLRKHIVVVPLYYASDAVLVGKRVRGFVPRPFGMADVSGVSVP